MAAILILSGSTGTRLGTAVPKQYIKICDRTIISFCIEVLAEHDGIDSIQIVAANRCLFPDRIYTINGSTEPAVMAGMNIAMIPLIPCKNCTACQAQHYELCRAYSYLGSRRDGGFAECAVVPEWNLIELPDNITYKQAAMMEPLAVATHAMRSALLPGCDRTTSIVVCGLGTIGLLLVMLLREAGYEKIYVVGNKTFQRDMAVDLGIDRGRFYDNHNEGLCGWLLE